MLQSYYIFLYDFSFCKIAVLYLGAFPAVLFTFLVKTGQNRSIHQYALPKTTPCPHNYVLFLPSTSGMVRTKRGGATPTFSIAHAAMGFPQGWQQEPLWK